MREPKAGRFCRVVALDPEMHATELFAANALDTDGRNWTYLPYGPFDTFERYRDWVERSSQRADPLFYAITDTSSGRAGVASYLDIDESNGTIEVGHIHYSPLLQRTAAGTEAMYLMMDHAFDLGFHRYEWKCDALNTASRAAAQRFGLSYEGIFRQARVVKGRNRDTAWYAAIDREWPPLRQAFLEWLDPSNFTDTGQQVVKLSDLTKPIIARIG